MKWSSHHAAGKLGWASRKSILVLAERRIQGCLISRKESWDGLIPWLSHKIKDKGGLSGLQLAIQNSGQYAGRIKGKACRLHWFTSFVLNAISISQAQTAICSCSSGLVLSHLRPPEDLFWRGQGLSLRPSACCCTIELWPSPSAQAGILANQQIPWSKWHQIKWDSSCRAFAWLYQNSSHFPWNAYLCTEQHILHWGNSLT